MILKIRIGICEKGDQNAGLHFNMLFLSALPCVSLKHVASDR